MLRNAVLLILSQLWVLGCSNEKDLKRSNESTPVVGSGDAEGKEPDGKTLDSTNKDPKNTKDTSTDKPATGENKPTPPPPAQEGEEAALEGELSGVSTTGRIYGFAYQKDRTDETIQVSVYVDNVAGAPVLTLQANLPGFDNGIPGDHNFAADLPMVHRDGKAHKVYIVLESMTGERAITPTGFNFTAYAPKAAGRQYYDATLRPLLQNRCVGCHQVNYEAHWANLLTPSPANGGTATNNLLFRKPAAVEAHGGGRICNNPTASPCAQIQEWWKREFAQ